MIEKKTDKRNRKTEIYYLDGIKVRINKGFKNFVIVLLIIINLFIIAYFTNRPLKASEMTELGIPTYQRYTYNNLARNAWDMIVFKDKLYIGCGDFNLNAGPVEVWCYDIPAGKWSNSGILPDEEIKHFVIINDELVITGTDPQEDWDYGNYYVLRGGKWVTVRTIPGGIHNFDMIEYKGELFAGIDVLEGGYPIRSSSDGGKTFKEVTMWKDGKLLDTKGSECIRTHDFFVQGKTLYATYWFEDKKKNELTYDLYRYENGRFVFDNQWNGKMSQLKNWNSIIGAKASFKNRTFFTTGYLYVTDDMKNIKGINFPKSEVVWDILTIKNSLYFLCSMKMDDGSYQNSVWETKTGHDRSFKKILFFNYEIPARSFAYNDGKFFFGMGEYSNENGQTGMVLMTDK